MTQMQCSACSVHMPQLSTVLVFLLYIAPMTTVVMQITVPGSADMSIQDYLASNYDFHYSFIGPVVGILLGFTVFFAGLAIVVLMTMNYQKR